MQQRHSIRDADHAPCGAGGGQQQAVDAAAREEAAVQVHLDVGSTRQLHLSHDAWRQRSSTVRTRWEVKGQSSD